MARSQQIIDTLKQELRAQGINYRQLADKLSLSESTIKHMFSSKNFSLRRLDSICEILNLELSDLVTRFETNSRNTDGLSIENEKLLISDIALLMVAYCVTNHWTVEEILDAYNISETECIRCLAQLDRMDMIELLPENRIRLRISNNFRWHPNGPIERFFRTEVQSHFFAGAFNSDQDIHMVKLGDLTDKSIVQIIERINGVGSYYEELSQQDRKQPFKTRHGTSMVLAIRKWDFKAFREYQK
ncbi:MAG: helix-turn-helix transcriptional regulator [Pseudomonadota bacterium]